MMKLLFAILLAFCGVAHAATVTQNLAITVTGSSPSDPTVGVLPSYNDSYPNWKMAGLQSVGGIPARSTICATLTPIGGTSSDATQINNAISACPAGQVVQLNVGTFHIPNGVQININKGVSLRGCTASPCSNSQMTDNCQASSGTAQVAGTTNQTNYWGLNGAPYCQTVIMVIDNSSNGTSAARLGCNNGSSACPGFNTPAIYIGDNTNSWVTSVNLTADAAQGDTSVVVSSASSFSVGQWVLLDQLNALVNAADPARGSGYTPEPVLASPDWSNAAGSLVVNGKQSATDRVAWMIHNPGVTGDDGTDVYCFFSRCTAGVDGRAVAEIHKISAISGNTITFDSPLTIAFQTSHTSQLTPPIGAFTLNAGLENVSVIGSTGGSTAFVFCAMCWVKGTEIAGWYGGGITANNTVRGEINRTFIHDAVWPIPGGAEYAIDFLRASTEMYIVDTISMLAGKAMTERAAGAGTVVAYNYFDKIMITGSGWQEMCINGSHTAGSHSTLFEGNWGCNIDDDSTHGTEFYHTFFRNLSTGIRSDYLDYLGGFTQSDANQSTSVMRGAGQQMYNYWHAFVGNVLGTPGITVPGRHGWQLNAAYANNGANNNAGIWFLGWRDVTPQPVDSSVATKTFMHGNYDYFNQKIEDGSGIGTGYVSGFSTTLPSSFYLAGKPAFFSGTCTYSWPWVTPAASPFVLNNSCGGSGNPAKARFDAGTPFVQP